MVYPRKKILAIGLLLCIVGSIYLSFTAISTAGTTTGIGVHSSKSSQHGKMIKNSIEREQHSQMLELRKSGQNRLHLSMVVCGDRAPETLISLKSVALLTEEPMTFHIFSESHLQSLFEVEISRFPHKENIKLHLYNLSFPESDSKRYTWRNLFKPCASQRLFLTSLLPHVDALLYVDTDTMFLRSLADVWNFFQKFNSTQTVGLAPEAEDGSAGWYNRFAKHPYFFPFGLNSGVMLMNLTRLRASSWEKDVKKYFKEYRQKIVFGDQDLINIYLHFHSDQVYVFPCSWNYRTEHCIYMSVCKDMEQNGISILHGSRRTFHLSKKAPHNQPAFKAIYDGFEKYDNNIGSKSLLANSIISELVSLKEDRCAKVMKSRLYFTLDNFTKKQRNMSNHVT